MEHKAVITSCSNKFFPSVVNLLGSIKVVYPNHPTIFVYDLGLWSVFRKELERIENVKVIPMPAFCGHWRSCYTWKTYILAHPLAELNFYLDAGCQLLKPLDEDFSIIEKEDILLIDQTHSFKAIVPPEYKNIFDVGNEFDDLTTIHAGIIGFKDTPWVTDIFRKVYDAGCVGLALGFSPQDRWRSKGKDKNIFVRNCDIFRHDLTLLNIFLRKHLRDTAVVRSLNLYHGGRNVVPEQRIWQLRLNYKTLDYIRIRQLHKNTQLLFVVNRIIIGLMIGMKNVNLSIKRSLGKI